MNFKLFFLGTIFFIVGMLMYFYIRKKKPASDKTNWNGLLMPDYITFWMTTILGIIVGLIFILKSLFN